MSKVTLQNIANEANVSVATVHRALTQKGDISNQTSRSIVALADKMGYSRKDSRQVSRKDGIVAILFCQSAAESLSGNPLNARLLSCLERVLADKGKLMGVVQARGGSKCVLSHFSGRIEGLFVIGSMTDSLKRQISNFNSVEILSRENWPDPFADIVTTDYWARGVMAAKYLIERGHKRIGFLNYKSEHPAFAHIEQSFMATAKACGRQVHVFKHEIALSELEATKTTTLSHEIQKDVMRQFLNMPLQTRPTGLHVANDEMVVGVYKSLRDHGIEPMVDVDIISSDNEETYLAQLDPRPATFDLNLEKLASAALQRLMNKINEESDRGVCVLVLPSLVGCEQFLCKQ